MHRFAVVDSAFHEGLHRQIEAQGAGFVSLFNETPEHALVEIAPLLVALDEVSSATVSLLLKLSQRSPCLSWFCSELDASALANHLKRFHTVRLQDGGTLLLRWYDTRVQSSLMDILDESQRSEFFCGIERWAYCDRFGKWREHAMPAPALETHMAGGSLELSSRQFSALLDASQPDVVLKHLARVLPDETQRSDPQALYALVKEQVEDASRLGWDGLDDQTQFLLPSLYTSGKAAKHPEFLRVMQTKAGDGEERPPLADRVQNLSEAVWTCGVPLWESAPRLAVGADSRKNLSFPDAA